jgi:hypothetical protein
VTVPRDSNGDEGWLLPLVQVVVPNLEKKSKSGKYFSNSGLGARGFCSLGLSDCGMAW